MRKFSFIILLSLLLLSAAGRALANGFSYVYIQGDKNTPFYVKFEDQMLPRYGKNYSIISQLAPGPINIQVLFQQNIYPAQKFTIMVPEDGFRGFILFKKGDAFALYDIQQQFYLYPGNKPEDDHTPPPAGTYVATNIIQQQPVVNKGNTKPAQGRPPVKTSSGPKFLPNVELNGERSIQPYNEPVQQQQQEPPVQAYNEPVQQQQQEPIVAEIPEEEYDNATAGATNEPLETEPPAATNNRRILSNSDCPSAMSEGEFEDLYNKTQSRAEKSKLKFLLTRMSDCYTTNHAKALAEALSNDPERYTFLKRIYPRVTDQVNFPALENLLSAQEWKDYFKLILPK